MRWPSDRSLADLDRRQTVAVAAYPRRWNVQRKTVWVAYQGTIVRQFKVARISDAIFNLTIAKTTRPQPSRERPIVR